MPLILSLSLLAALLAAVLPNDTLARHSYILYAVQFLTMIPYLLSRAVYLKNLFLPTFFVLVYFLVNLTFGSYLVPREYGWYKGFAAITLDVQHYNLIVPFFLLSNVILFALTARAFSQLAPIDVARDVQYPRREEANSASLAKLIFYCAAFFAVSYYPVYSAFSFQLVLLILYFTDSSLRGRWYRYGVYMFALAVLLGVSYENKREIAMVLFLIVFFEAYQARLRIRFTLKSVAAYSFVALSFFGLILAASILRGYGAFPVVSIVDAFRYIPQYMTSDIFIDGVVDNLELNFNYGVAITSIDHMLRARIDYQYGASIIKVLFLPIPRDAIGFKPESTMQLFTQSYDLGLWRREGSLPVMSASEMFMNFHVFGLLAFAFVWSLMNKVFLTFHTVAPRSFVACSCVFLFITVLMFARGSGLEQWLLYYLIAAPVLLVLKLVGNSVQPAVAAGNRWVV